MLNFQFLLIFPDIMGWKNTPTARPVSLPRLGFKSIMKRGYPLQETTRSQGLESAPAKAHSDTKTRPVPPACHEPSGQHVFRTGSTARLSAGFTIVEIAIVLTMAGLAFFAIANTYTSLDRKVRQDRTALNFALVQDALAAFAERNYRLPCPMRPDYAIAGEPYGTEAGSGVNGNVTPANCPVLEGLIPFRTLGLDQDITKDGFGHFITYRVSRAQARNPNDGATVHENCRARVWMHTDMSGATVNINPQLARFCCRDPEGVPNDLDLDFRRTVASGVENLWTLTVDGINAQYANVNTAGPAIASSAVNRNTTTPIYVLLSHGVLGIGSFNLEGTGARQGGRMGTDETVNAVTASSTFIVSPPSDVNAARHYDDMIAWGTQDTLLARGSGRFSCHAPARN